MKSEELLHKIHKLSEEFSKEADVDEYFFGLYSASSKNREDSIAMSTVHCPMPRALSTLSIMLRQWSKDYPDLFMLFMLEMIDIIRDDLFKPGMSLMSIDVEEFVKQLSELGGKE